MFEILRRRDEIITPPPREIYYHYSVWQEKFDQMSQFDPKIKFIQGLPLEDCENDKQHKLIVLDDLLEESSKSNDVFNLFCRGSHHNLKSVIFLTQNFFHKNLRGN